MSDMRLTSSKTKMKIILCIFLLCNTAVSVFGQSVELNGIVGRSVNFPAAVKIDGSLRYSGVPIGNVTSGRFTRARSKFSGRLQWNSSTGFFSLSALRLEDSGVYTVQNTDQNIITVFQLNVHINVSKPHLNVTRNEYRCTVLCAGARGTGATLTLYREGEKNPYVTSPVRSHPHLDMTVPVESGTYTCEAKNSVSSETSDPLTVEAHCTAPAAPAAPSSLSTGTIVGIIFAVVAIIIGVVVPLIAVLYRRIKKEHADTKSKLDGTSSKLEDTKSKLDGTSSKLEGTSSKLEVTRSELEDTKSKLDDTKSKLDVTRSELEVTRSELEGIKKEHAVTRSELEVTRSELEGIKKEHAGIKKEHAVTRSELEGIKKEHAVTRSELEDTKSKLDVTKSELKVTKSELKGIKMEHAETSSNRKNEQGRKEGVPPPK